MLTVEINTQVQEDMEYKVVFTLIIGLFPAFVLMGREMTLRMNSRHSNKMPKTGVASLATGKGIYDCASLCLLTRGCRTIFYRKSDKRCYGYNKIVSDDTDLEHAGGVICYDQLDDLKRKCNFHDFTIMDGFCVLVSNYKSKWFPARYHCQTMGGDLVMLKTEDKIIEIVDYIYYTGQYEHFHIGMSDTYREGTMKWVDRSSVQNYSFFGDNQPDNRDGPVDGADCGMFNVTDLLVHDSQCHRSRYFICEILF